MDNIGQLKVTVWVTCTPHYKCVLAKLVICFVTHTHGSKRIVAVFSGARLSHFASNRSLPSPQLRYTLPSRFGLGRLASTKKFLHFFQVIWMVISRSFGGWSKTSSGPRTARRYSLTASTPRPPRCAPPSPLSARTSVDDEFSHRSATSEKTDVIITMDSIYSTYINGSTPNWMVY